jgi:hypothetical protein
LRARSHRKRVQLSFRKTPHVAQNLTISLGTTAGVFIVLSMPEAYSG